jgi:hydroxypyruvate reductase
VLVERAIDDPAIGGTLQRGDRVHVIAVGKAARPMLAGLACASSIDLQSRLVVSPTDAGHPVPDERSVAAARGALAMARSTSSEDLLLVLLSGGASALMALPRDSLSLEAKQEMVRTLLARGANITELNTVRKHLSGIKGGQLASACGGSVLTLAISDVVGDDLSVIASGPTVPDPTTFHDALAVIDARGGRRAYPTPVVSLLERGAAGHAAETPKPGAASFMRSTARVIGSAADALGGARTTAESLGYHVHTIEEPVVGDARSAAVAHVQRVAALAAKASRPLCVLSAGETTVHVTGGGKGGRNQEFALAMAGQLEALGSDVAAASVGTDGVDGPTDAAGAQVDATTLVRARARHLDPDTYLRANNTYAFFRALGDVILTGPTNTNVGDIQVILIDSLRRN